MSGISRRQYSVGAAAALGGLLAAACGVTGAGQAPAGGAKPARQPATLRLNYRTEKGIPERAKEFGDAHPGLTVDLVADSGYDKLMTLAAAGDLGDVIWGSAGIGTYFELAAAGHFLQLDPVVSREKFDLKQYFPRAVEEGRLEGKLYGLPEVLHPGVLGLFYNVTLFENAGVKPPTLNWTVDDLLDAARRLTADTDRDGRPDRWGVQFGTAYNNLTIILRCFGGEFLDPPAMGKKVAINQGPAKQAFQWLYDLRHKHRVHPVEGVDKASFTDGTLAMQQNGMWGATQARTIGDRFKMDAVLVPKGPGGKRGSQGHAGFFSVNARTKYPEEAWLLAKWHTNKESALRQARLDSGVPGARPDAWNDPEVLARPMYKVFKDLMEKETIGPYAVPWNFRSLEMDKITPTLFAPLWRGEQAPEQAITAALGPYQQILDQPRPGKR